MNNVFSIVPKEELDIDDIACFNVSGKVNEPIFDCVVFESHYDLVIPTVLKEDSGALRKALLCFPKLDFSSGTESLSYIGDEKVLYNIYFDEEGIDEEVATE